MADVLGPRRNRVAWVGRVSLLIADQGLNSSTNVVALVLIASRATGQQFGVFATIQLCVLLGQTVAMAAFCDRWLQAEAEERPARFATGMMVYKLTAAALVGVAALVVPALGLNAALVGVAAIPAIAGLDYIRVVLFATNRPWTAIFMDLSYGALQFLGIGVWIGSGGSHGATGAWLAWALAAYVVFGVFAAGIVRAQPLVARGHRERVRSAVGLRYGAEMLLVNGSGHLALLIVSARLGVAFTGILRATSIPFGPLIVLLQAGRVILIPSFSTVNESRSKRLLFYACLAYTSLWVACTALTFTVTQTPSMQGLIGGIHPSASFVLFTSVFFLTTGLHLLFYFYFRARRWDQPVLVSRFVLVTAVILSTVVSVLYNNSSVFLILASANWVAATVAMVLARGRPIARTASPGTLIYDSPHPSSLDGLTDEKH